VIPEFHYKLGWRVPARRPGFHASTATGAGMEFVGHASLAGGADPRRIDVRASLASHSGEWLVRVHRARSAVSVHVLLDVSASMGFAGVQRKVEVVTQFVESAAFSARRTGDAFGLVAADDAIRSELRVPASHARSAVQLVVERLRDIRPANGSAGLLSAAEWLPRSRALVFLVSDFHFPLDQVAALLDATAHHELVPIVVWDAAEWRLLPKFGLVDLLDPETGSRRTVLMRASVRARWRAAADARRATLTDCFRSRRRRPFFVDGRFDADALTRYFLGEDPHAA